MFHVGFLYLILSQIRMSNVLTRRELCLHIINKAQQKYGKVIGELDLYYVDDEVSLAMFYLGLVNDPSIIERVKSTPPYIIKTMSKGLTYSELLDLLPEEGVEKVNQPEVPKTEPLTEINADIIRQILGDRVYYKLLDLQESLDPVQLDAVVMFLTKTQIHQ